MEKSIKEVLVTPEYAAELLKFNTHNRNLRSSVVDKYARLMRGGEWILVNDAIVISKGNVLLNGQHRLSAVVKAGVSVPFIIYYGAEEEAFDVMDTAVTRSMGDVLNHHGAMLANEMASSLSVFARFCDDADNGTQKRLMSNAHPYSRRYILDLYEQYGESLYPYVCAIKQMYKTGFRIVPISKLAGMALYLDVRLHYKRDNILRFCSMLYTDHHKDDYSVALVRRTLLNGKLSRKKIATEENMRYVIYAWNAYAKNRIVKAIPTMADTFVNAVLM